MLFYPLFLFLFNRKERLLGRIESKVGEIYIEAYTNEHDAEDAMRKKYAEEVAALSKELEYSEYDSNNRTARIYGEVTVVVLGVQEVNVKQKEVK